MQPTTAQNIAEQTQRAIASVGRTDVEWRAWKLAVRARCAAEQIALAVPNRPDLWQAVRDAHQHEDARRAAYHRALDASLASEQARAQAA